MLENTSKKRADPENSESVKLVLAIEEAKRARNEKCWSQNRRRNIINAYTLYLTFQGRTWKKPTCTVDEKKPFIPQESEIDTLIAGTFRKLSTFLQLLKETAFRSGEAHRLKWTDIDQQRRIITLNDPEKHSNSRMIEVSQNLIDMLNNLPKKDPRIFPTSQKGFKVTFSKARKKLSQKLNNPRLLAIHFHTFRHWKATMLYHETQDIYYVKNFLGHKSVKNTESYIEIEKAIFKTGGPNNKFFAKATRDPQEILDLIADGWEEETRQGDLIYFKKRK